MYLTREEIRRKAGQCLIIGFEGKTLDPELKELLREIKPLGLILFARNIESPAAVRELNCELKSFHKTPLLLTVDQEGGRVARVRAPATEWPAMGLLERLPNAAAQAQAVASAIGRELRALNFDVNYAPVLDVDTNPLNPIIGQRAFSTTPAGAAELGVSFMRGLHESGVAACGKHFPGHGDTNTDSHLTLPSVTHDLQRLREVEWPPFKAAIEAGLDAIMTAHVLMPALDEHLPATLSEAVLQRYLREELAFTGVIISDDVEMQGVAGHFTPEEIAQRGAKAGVDIFLACRQPAVSLAIYRGLVTGVEAGVISMPQLEAAARRAEAFQGRWYKREPEGDLTVLAQAHAELAASLA